ncbi:MAG: 23S rRNA (pseudouridine(1915)-N(3))-methyltransferase RlmH [Candidatus Competibacterales bacterium]|nr:23S rRNA (pseudouridine(1915)-N(3))-methyltransferase RlmH [Candidatus Competibacterales bacterium]
MRLRLVAIGTRMPAWVDAGFRDYADRLPRECRLELTEIPAPRRGRNADAARLMRTEAERLRSAVPASARLLALDQRGQAWSTENLAARLRDWLADGRDVALLTGGPDGLDPALREQAELCWSLSALTLPHPLVRVIVAEQLYRAWSLLSNHPYHRA